MQNLTTGQTKALKDLQDYFEYARNSYIRKNWYGQYMVNLSFYRGNQWLDPKVTRDMDDIGATPYTFNNIEPLVNTFTSLQLRSSKRVGYEASSDNKKHIELAEYLKQLAYSIQTQNNYNFAASQKFTSSLIGGLGWSYFYYEDGKFLYDYIDPKEIYWDPDDKSAKLDNMSFVCRAHYVLAAKLKERFPEHAKWIDGMVDENSTEPDDLNNVIGQQIWERESGANTNTVYAYDEDEGRWTKGRTIRIVEVYYKKPEKYYETTTLFPREPQVVNPNETDEQEREQIQTEHVFSSFNKEFVEENSINGDIIEKKGTRIYHGVFCDNFLLSHNPIVEQVPNQKHLPLTPVVLKRDFQGMPYGIVDNLIPIQKAHNFLWSTALHYLDAKTLIINDEVTDINKSQELLRNEMRKKNGVAFVRNPQEMQVLDHEKNIAHRMNMFKSNYREFETQTGLFDELKGEQTNAVSGVAIQQRATNAMNSQNSLILAYENMILSEGKQILDTIKGIKKFQYSLKFSRSGQPDTATLDESISLLDFEVYPDVAPNFSSSIEEEKARFAELLNSKNPAILLSSPLFLQELGFRESAAYDLSKEYLRITGQLQQEQLEEEQQQAQENPQETQGV